eukprot:1511739-Rhodomonas_salina.2
MSLPGMAGRVQRQVGIRTCWPQAAPDCSKRSVNARHCTADTEDERPGATQLPRLSSSRRSATMRPGISE